MWILPRSCWPIRRSTFIWYQKRIELSSFWHSLLCFGRLRKKSHESKGFSFNPSDDFQCSPLRGRQRPYWLANVQTHQRALKSLRLIGYHFFSRNIQATQERQIDCRYKSLAKKHANHHSLVPLCTASKHFSEIASCFHPVLIEGDCCVGGLWLERMMYFIWFYEWYSMISENIWTFFLTWFYIWFQILVLLSDLSNLLMQFCDGNQTSRFGHFQRGSVLFRGHFCDVAFTTDSMDLLEKIARIIDGDCL